MHRATEQEDIGEDWDEVGEVIDRPGIVSLKLPYCIPLSCGLHRRTHHCVESCTRAQVNEAQKGNNDIHNELGVERVAESRMDPSPTDDLSGKTQI